METCTTGVEYFNYLTLLLNWIYIETLGKDTLAN